MISTQSDHSYRLPKSGAHQSQHGEDRWLDSYFRNKYNGFFVEVGAYDGVVLSNTYFFEIERQWTGILIEPDSKNAANCRANRSNSEICECAAVGSPEIAEIAFFKVSGGEVYSTVNLVESHAQRLEQFGLTPTETKVAARTLDQIFAKSEVKSIDFISIDVEEGELDVLKGFDICRWMPKIMMIESNSVERDPLIREYFVRHGYAYLHSIAINDLYRPAFGGRILSGPIDWFRYSNALRKRTNTSALGAMRKFLDRHLFWRFKK